MVKIIRKRPIYKEDIAFDTAGQGQTDIILNSLGLEIPGTRINTDHIPLPQIVRDKLSGVTSLSEALSTLSDISSTSYGDATAIKKGLIQLATVDEGKALNVTTKAITPAVLGQIIASQTSAGIVQFASSIEMQSGVNNRAVTPAVLLTAFWKSGDTRNWLGGVAPVGWLNLNGAEISRTSYGNLWTFAQDNSLIVDESVWASNRKKFSTGNGSSTFRIPDYATVETNSFGSYSSNVANNVLYTAVSDGIVSAYSNSGSADWASVQIQINGNTVARNGATDAWVGQSATAFVAKNSTYKIVVEGNTGLVNGTFMPFPLQNTNSLNYIIKY